MRTIFAVWSSIEDIFERTAYCTLLNPVFKSLNLQKTRHKMLYYMYLYFQNNGFCNPLATSRIVRKQYLSKFHNLSIRLVSEQNFVKCKQSFKPRHIHSFLNNVCYLNQLVLCPDTVHVFLNWFSHDTDRRFSSIDQPKLGYIIHTIFVHNLFIIEFVQ